MLLLQAEPSRAPDALQHCCDPAEADHGHGRWAPRRQRTRLAAEWATAGAAGAADRPQRAKRQPLRFEDYQQGSIAVQDTAEVRLGAPDGGWGRKGTGPPQSHGGRKAAEEAAEKAAGPPKRRLVRLSDLDPARQADNGGAHAPLEGMGGRRGRSGPADVEIDGCDDVGEADNADGEEEAPFEEDPEEVSDRLV